MASYWYNCQRSPVPGGRTGPAKGFPRPDDVRHRSCIDTAYTIRQKGNSETARFSQEKSAFFRPTPWAEKRCAALLWCHADGKRRQAALRQTVRSKKPGLSSRRLRIPVPSPSANTPYNPAMFYPARSISGDKRRRYIPSAIS